MPPIIFANTCIAPDWCYLTNNLHPSRDFERQHLEPRAWFCIKDSSPITWEGRGQMYALYHCPKTFKTFQVQQSSLETKQSFRWEVEISIGPFRDIYMGSLALLLSYLIKSSWSDTANRNLSTGRGLPMKMGVVPVRWLSLSQFLVTQLKTCAVAAGSVSTVIVGMFSSFTVEHFGQHFLEVLFYLQTCSFHTSPLSLQD